MVVFKKKVRPTLGIVLTPVLWLGRFFVRPVAVRAFRLWFAGRRHASKIYLPARERFLYMFSNRFAIHFAIVAVALVASAVNFSGSEVRAENFGERSTLYALVANDDSYLIEEVSADEIREPEPTSYLGEGLLESGTYLSEIAYEETHVNTIGGGALVSPTIQEGGESIAPRTEIEMYVVEDGDTVSSIAEKFGVSTSTVLWANGLGAWSYIRPGDELKIPPVSGVIHAVTSGETLIQIANEYEVEADDIIAFNALADSSDIVIGEELIIPGGVKRTAVPAATSSSSGSSSSGSGASTYSGTYSGSTGGWVWPSDLRVITQYYGWSHGGLDIDCGYTHHNYAANSGVVTYSGWNGGYGLMVEIDHGGGIKTRYGHFSSLAVSAGQNVGSGQDLGVCGTTGRSTGTHLHFEVLVNGGTRNPLSYIR